MKKLSRQFPNKSSVKKQMIIRFGRRNAKGAKIGANGEVGMKGWMTSDVGALFQAI